MKQDGGAHGRCGSMLSFTVPRSPVTGGVWLQLLLLKLVVRPLTKFKGQLLPHMADIVVAELFPFNNEMII